MNAAEHNHHIVVVKFLRLDAQQRHLINVVATQDRANAVVCTLLTSAVEHQHRLVLRHQDQQHNLIHAAEIQDLRSAVLDNLVILVAEQLLDVHQPREQTHVDNTQVHSNAVVHNRDTSAVLQPL